VGPERSGLNALAGVVPATGHKSRIGDKKMGRNNGWGTSMRRQPHHKVTPKKYRCTYILGGCVDTLDEILVEARNKDVAKELVKKFVADAGINMKVTVTGVEVWNG